MKRFLVPAVVALLFCALLCPVAVQAQDSAADSSLEVPRIIIFTSARWHYVTMLEEKYGTYVYAKPGGYPIAVTEYEFDKKRTLEVNGALRDLVAICQGEAVDPSRVFALKTRSRKIFGEVVREKLEACYQQLRNRQEQARLRALEQQPDTKLSDIAGEVSIANGGEGPDTVITNETVGHGDAAFTVGAQNLAAKHDHQEEYLFNAKAIIEDECWDEWGDDSRLFHRCLISETNAVEELKARPVGRTPLDVFNGIRDECRNRWMRNFRLRNECEVDQIRFFWAIESKAGNPDFSPQAIEGFKKTCSAKWPGDYQLQDDCIEEMMEAARHSPKAGF